MSEKKIRITKAQRLADVIHLLNGEDTEFGTTTEEAVNVVAHEIDLLAKKNASDSKKQTEAQKKNEEYKAMIVDFLSSQTEGKTCTEIGKSIAELSEFNNQKISSLVRQLKEAGKVRGEMVKGKALFYIA